MTVKGIKAMLYEALKKEFETEYITIIDESQEHTNHPSMMYIDSKESHFKIYIKSKRFNGLKPTERHRLVNEAISFAFDLGLHAVKIRTEVDE